VSSAIEQPVLSVFDSDDTLELSTLQREIEHAAHLLPTQGPITVFIHHNTLHAFEHLPFEEAVVEAQRVLGPEPYQSEVRFRQELDTGRIRPHDLHAVLLEELDDQGDVLIGCLGTRHELQLVMLRYPLYDGSDNEIGWFIHEADALYRFREDIPPQVRRWLLESTRHWLRRDVLAGRLPSDEGSAELIAAFTKRFNTAAIDSWSDASWEAATLFMLWWLACRGANQIPVKQVLPQRILRPRDALLQRTGRDTDQLVNAELTRFCAAYLDQGYAGWQLPKRERGFLMAYCELVCDSHPVESWLDSLPRELVRLQSGVVSPLASIAESLAALGVTDAEREEFLRETLLALRGWAGMLWQMETNGEWTVRPARKGTLIEYLAIRLLLERLALTEVARQELDYRGTLADLRSYCHVSYAPPRSSQHRAFQVFQLAQLRGWSPSDLCRLSVEEWMRLIIEIESFGELHRRRIYHLAYERRYRNQALDAVSIFSQRHLERIALEHPAKTLSFQVVFCIDDREESFRRLLEEVDPEVETFGIAGFFGVAMYYRGAAEAYYRPLCPIVIKPQHYVAEVPVFSLDGSGERQVSTRRRMGRLSHHLHLQTRTAMGGFFAGLFGSITSLPLVLRILFPRFAARITGTFRHVVEPLRTQLHLERTAPQPGPAEEALGYSIEEMATIVHSGLRAMGLTKNFAPLIFILGHGSGSLNNPHEAAYDCGACGGGCGGPNGRAFAAMANEPRVRELLADWGLVIPAEVFFVGGSHNTCSDSLQYFDLDRLPQSKWSLFSQAKQSLDAARMLDAQERCRRFESAPFSLDPPGALKHAENRSEDLSQVRPEYCHATNGVCVVGRRTRTRDLFMDRRAFLTSYDPTQDDEQSTILAGLLSGVIPICAGISLEYYFSAVDNVGYGCGSKLPHNLASLIGVMEGAESDLRTGLSAQMVEIHEPMRVLFVVETTPEAMLSIMKRNPMIDQLVRNEWVQLSLLDPRSDQLQLFCNGKFQPYYVEDLSLPIAKSSVDWFRGWRGHLGFAELQTEFLPDVSGREVRTL
jgi:uncharacterized protein YbcC (UPF0753/DUF2309 family)